MKNNVIQINGGITINVDMCVKHNICEKHYIRNSATCNCENEKYLQVLWRIQQLRVMK